MSRSAILAQEAVSKVLGEAGLGEQLSELGCFMGVGASGGAPEQLSQLLIASDEGGAFSHARFGDAGLRACNPLFAFQLMNNFTLCHTAILHGIGGPNAAYFSRGGGTVSALLEAAWALRNSECEAALAGAADSAVHPVTWAELVREGAPSDLVLGEGAAMLALARSSEQRAPLAFLEVCTLLSTRATSLGDALELARPELERLAPDLVVVAASGGSASALDAFIAAALPARRTVDSTSMFGEALAASPALAWAQALALLEAGGHTRALVLSVGLDGELGIVSFRRGALR
jgi:hypothetical protein